MIKLQTLIIEDELPAQQLLMELCNQIPELQIIGTASDGFDGLKQINAMKPDLIFLDIDMPRLTGIELVECLEVKPAIVFTTAYDQYAVKAFEENAVDYLLKPFSFERLNMAVERVLKRINEGSVRQEYAQTLKSASGDDYLERMVIKLGNRIHIMQVSDMDYAEANDDYIYIYSGEQRYLKQQTLQSLENNLDPNQFVRLHRSILGNVYAISKILSAGKDCYEVLLKSGRRVPVSRSGYKRLKTVLKL
ncbi:MAG: LytTR family transcriptional regulator DNA-binding domain-containing protein [Cyclobacteriaceae bacterium]|nr:LytTR family transcriptional regulator DNA-binding domain-containing protein [Cyclobacteriaceae bacterium]